MKLSTLRERVKLAERAEKLVILVAENHKNAQFRYRCLNLMEATEVGKWTAVWFLKHEIKTVRRLLARAKLVVIERQTDKDGVMLGLIEQARAAGVKVVFDLDDLIFDYRDLPLLMKSTNSRNVFYWVGYFWGVRRIARRVDGFICTNEFLAGKLKRSFKKPVAVVPNSLNREQVKMSEEAVLAGKKHDGFVVGYFSGSPTHVKDFRAAEGGLVKFLREHEDARLRVVGYMEFSAEMRELAKAGRVEVLELVDYLKLQKLMAEVDVNIAPLLINDFTNCKSELKFFEAAAVETATVASPSYAFAQAIVDGENGFLAEPGEWFDKLEFLYKNAKVRKKVAAAAKKYALEYYYGAEFLKKVEEAFEELSGDGDE